MYDFIKLLKGFVPSFTVAREWVPRTFNVPTESLLRSVQLDCAFMWRAAIQHQSLCFHLFTCCDIGRKVILLTTTNYTTPVYLRTNWDVRLAEGLVQVMCVSQYYRKLSIQLRLIRVKCAFRDFLCHNNFAQVNFCFTAKTKL